MKKLFLILLLTFNSFADSGIVPIKKGEPAPGDGFYITYEQEKKFRLIEEEKLRLEAINITLKDLQITHEEQIKLLNMRINSYEDHTSYLEKRLSEARLDGFWNRTIYFVGGMLLMGGSVYLAGHLNR
jgi:hypothetical protein